MTSSRYPQLMSLDADNRRNLFRKVVDDLVDQIRTGKLSGGEVLPTAKKLAEQYDMASMTVQRALRELQERGLTYAVVGKGTYVHPEAAQRLAQEEQWGPEKARELTPAIADRDLNRRMAQYILKTDQIAAKLVQAWEARDNDAAHRAVEELEVHKNANQDLAADLAKYEATADRPEPATPVHDSAGSRPRKHTARPRKTTE